MVRVPHQLAVPQWSLGTVTAAFVLKTALTPDLSALSGARISNLRFVYGASIDLGPSLIPEGVPGYDGKSRATLSWLQRCLNYVLLFCQQSLKECKCEAS